MGVRLEVIQEQLRAQQDLSAVERFAQLHDEGQVGHQPLYEARIPLSRPQAGQQYAFSVDLDACTGCKACVSGCNKQNGLDHDEAWRAVGVVISEGLKAPVQQTVTTACHHCLDPACMTGCPVGAYEKNEETGIVKHLDDQCIGCQYCTLTCPYDVPQYNERLGIVRKCDMCQDRLAESQAPACVDSCPNGAISIEVVDVADVEKRALNSAFFPKTPASDITRPTTSFVSQTASTQVAEPANLHCIKPGHAHLPLATMLPLIQLSVGTFTLTAILETSTTPSAAFQGATAVVATATGAAALGAATFHLGRPLYAFRAIVGLGTSWMSREVVALGGFVKFAALFCLLTLFPKLAEWAGISSFIPTEQLRTALLWTTVSMGILGVLCGVMIYVVTRRGWWSAPITLSKFLGTTVVLGLASGATIATFAEGQFGPPELAVSTQTLLGLWMVTAAAKMAYELTLLSRGLAEKDTDLYRSALLMSRDLAAITRMRFAFGLLGGIILPAAVLVQTAPSSSLWTSACALFGLLICAGGEWLERVLYFSAMSSPRMPGSFGK